MEVLIGYGSNYMVLDYYFAFMVAAHQLALNRCEYVDAVLIEDLFKVYLEMTKSNAEVAISWMMRIKRLIKLKDYNQAHLNIGEYHKFCSQYGFVQMKLEVDLLSC